MGHTASANAVVGVIWGLCIFPSIVFVIVRFIVRYRYPESFNFASDFFILSSLILQITCGSLTTTQYSLYFYDNEASIFIFLLSLSSKDSSKGLRVGFAGVQIQYLCLFAIKGAIISIFYTFIP